MLYGAKQKKSISHSEVDTRNVFLNEKEFLKITSIFFEENTPQKQRLAQQFEENIVRSQKAPEVNHN